MKQGWLLIVLGRYGARMLLKMPGFSLIAALTLSLGIAADMTLLREEDVNACELQSKPKLSEAHKLTSLSWV
jgi:hypothetical protein